MSQEVEKVFGSQNMLKRGMMDWKRSLTPLILGPSFRKAKLEGAKTVPPMWFEVSAIAGRRPVFVRPSTRVLNSPGRNWMMVAIFGGGMSRLSTPWITPFVPNWARSVNIRLSVGVGERTISMAIMRL